MRIPFLTAWLESARVRTAQRTLEQAVLTKQHKALTESHPFMSDTLTLGGNLQLGHGQHGDPFGHAQAAKHMRAISRQMIATNPTAHGIIGILVRLVFGKGYSFRSLNERAQELWDEFAKANLWSRREKEWGRRCWRDGEQLTRKFHKTEWPPKIRFLEPENIDDTTGKFPDGIEFEPGDAETPVSYFKVNPKNRTEREVIPAASVQHSKISVDLATPRGVPLLAVDTVDLEQLQATRFSMGQKAKIAADHVMVQRYHGASNQQVASIAAKKQVDHPVIDHHGREIKTMDQSRPGKWVLANDNISYEWQNPGVGADEQHIVSRDTALAVGADVGLPEYQVRGDASNANRASQQVAETQAQATAEGWQDFFKDEFLLLWDWVMAEAVLLGKLDGGEDLSVTIEAPAPIRADLLEVAKALQIYRADGILSPQTYSTWLNLEYDQEQAKIKEHQEAMPDTQPATTAGTLPDEDEPTTQDEPGGQDDDGSE